MKQFIVGKYKYLNTYEKRNIYEKNGFLSMNVLCTFTDIKRRNFKIIVCAEMVQFK